MGRFFRWLIGDSVKTGLWYGLYRYWKPIKTKVVRTYEAATDLELVEAAKAKLLGHYNASKWQFKLAMWLSIAALIGSGFLGMVLHFVPNLGNADEIRYWGETVIVPVAAFIGLILMYLAAKVVIVDALLEFIWATVIYGWKTAVRLLPSFIGQHIEGVIDPLAKPIINMAAMARDLVLSVVMGFVSLALFLVVSRISLDINGSAVVVLAVTGIVAAILHAKKETKWLRPVTWAMSVIALVVTASVSVYRASITVADIRDDCIEQYLSHGIPKDAKMVKLCEANVETGTMANMNEFVGLLGKELTPKQLAKFSALKDVLKGAKKGDQKPFVVHTPPPPPPKPAPTATLPTTAPATTPAPKPKSPKAPKPVNKTAVVNQNASAVVASSGANSAQAERFRALEAKYGIR